MITGSITASLGFFGTASYALTASYVLDAISSSFASTASFAPNYVLNSNTSSFVQNSQTSSMSVNTASFASTASFYSGPTTTTFVGNCNSFSIPNGSLFYGAYLGGTPVNPTIVTTRTGSFANGFFPGYPMPAGTASNLTLIIATTQSSNNTSFVYIANANSAITGSVITLAAGSAAGIYSSSANPVSFAQGNRLTVILSNPFVAGSSGSATITTFSFIYRNT